MDVQFDGISVDVFQQQPVFALSIILSQCDTPRRWNAGSLTSLPTLQPHIDTPLESREHRGHSATCCFSTAAPPFLLRRTFVSQLRGRGSYPWGVRIHACSSWHANRALSVSGVVSRQSPRCRYLIQSNDRDFEGAERQCRGRIAQRESERQRRQACRLNARAGVTTLNHACLPDHRGVKSQLERSISRFGHFRLLCGTS